MKLVRPFAAQSTTEPSRVQPTPLQAWEDAVGTCNTCPGELLPAEELQREPVRKPPPYPWRDLGAGLCIVFAVMLVAHFAVPVSPTARVAAK
jgi:hypothetical protein